MADIHEEARIPVYINDEQAKSAMKTLQAEAEKWKKAMFDAMSANDLTGMKQAEDQLKKINRQMTNLKREAFDANKVLENLSQASRADILKTEQALRKQIDTVKRGTKEYKDYHAQLQRVLAEKSKINTELNGQLRTNQGWFSRAADSANKYFNVVMAGIATLTGIAFGFKKASQTANDFEERVDNLSSLTGLAGEELQWLEQRAKDLSTATLEGGVKVKQGAQEIVDAFTKTGSARPELLANKEALSEVTEEAIILANAAKTDLQPAIESLTMMLNQFNAPASHSRRIINALAAGSKAGAGEIPYLTTATEKAGTVAADAGMKYETLIATIETLAPRITQAEIAGRSLKGVILDMQNSTDDINPSIVGWTTALENLNKKHLSTTELTKMFGTENITTAKILLNNIGELKKYEAAVTGTNVAIEQASINTANNNAKLAQARNRLEEVTIDLGKKLSPALIVSTNGFSYFVKIASAGIDILTKHGRTIVTSAAAIAGYTIAIKSAAYYEAAYAAVKGVLTGQITLATIAQKGWNLALKANPIGLIIGIIAGGIAWLISWNKETGKITAAFQKLGPVIDDIKKYFTDLYNESFLVRAGFHYFFAMLSTGFTAVTAVLRSFWEQLKLGGKLLKAVLTFDLKGIKEAFADYGANMKDVALDSAKKIGETWATGFNAAVKGKIQPVEVPVYGPLQSKQNTGITFSGIGDLVTAQNPYIRPGKPSPNKSGKIKPTTTTTPAETQDPGKWDWMLEPAEEETDISWVTRELETEAQRLAEKKASEQEWTDFMKRMVDERMAAADEENQKYQEDLAFQKEIAEAKKQLVSESIGAFGQLASAMASMFKEGSTAQIAALAIEKGAAIAQIIFNTAVANAKAVAMSPLTAGQPWVGINTVSAAASIAGIVATTISSFKDQKNNDKPGFSDGGPTGDGGKYEVAGVVHKKEYVIPSEGTENPKLRPVIDLIEIARRNGTLARLDLRPLVQMVGAKSLAVGGHSSTYGPGSLPINLPASGNPGLDPATANRLIAALEKFEQKKLVVYTELIKKDLDTLNEIEQKR